jgi:hypothetical protein
MFLFRTEERETMIKQAGAHSRSIATLADVREPHGAVTLRMLLMLLERVDCLPR